MTEKIFEFTDSTVLGQVVSVDTHRVMIGCEESGVFPRATVGKLIAIEGRIPQEQLIAVVERATRAIESTSSMAEDGSTQTQLVLKDAVQAVLVGTFKSREGDRRNVFRRGADTFPRIDRPTYLIEGANLAALMGLLSADVPEGQRMRLGYFVGDDDAAAVADGDRFFQRHAAILGSTGSGKSWAVATVLECAAALKHPNIIVFDMHGEYAPLSEAPNGYAQRFKVAGPADLTSPNKEALFLPYWLLTREEMSALLIDRNEITAANQTARVTEHVRALKEEKLIESGKEALSKLFTVDSPIPYDISDLRKRLTADNTEMEIGSSGKDKQGKFFGQFSRLLARMDGRISDRRYGFMFSPPPPANAYDWLADLAKSLLSQTSGSGIKIIDFSEIPADILPVVAGLLARLIYNIQFWLDAEKRTPICFVCDEAHLYLPTKDDADAVQRQALAAFERIAKEGRKYGVSLLVVSQRPSDVSRTILSQCNNFLALRLTNETDQSVVRRLMPDALGGLTDILPLLDTGEALMLGDAMLLPTRIRMNPPKVPPQSATRKFWTEWADKPSNPAAISMAVENMRAQSRKPS